MLRLTRYSLFLDHVSRLPRHFSYFPTAPFSVSFAESSLSYCFSVGVPQGSLLGLFFTLVTLSS